MKILVKVNYDTFKFDNLADAEKFAVYAAESYQPDFYSRNTDDLEVIIKYTDIDGFDVTKTKSWRYVKDDVRDSECTDKQAADEA